MKGRERRTMAVAVVAVREDDLNHGGQSGAGRAARPSAGSGDDLRPQVRAGDWSTQRTKRILQERAILAGERERGKTARRPDTGSGVSAAPLSS